MNKIRLGLFGTGYAADYHAFTVAKTAFFTIVAVADYSLALARDFARRHHVDKYYGDLEYLLEDEDVDMVVVATPTPLHLDAFRYISATGRSIIMETPLSSSFRQGMLMAEKMDEEGIYLFPVSPLLSDPLSLYIKEKISKDGFDSYSLSYSFPSPLERWMRSRNGLGPIDGTKLFLEAASPVFDLFSFWIGNDEIRGVEKKADGYSVIFERGRISVSTGSPLFSFSLVNKRGRTEGRNGKIIYSSMDEKAEEYYGKETMKSPYSLLPLWYDEVYETLESGVWTDEKCRCATNTLAMIDDVFKFLSLEKSPVLNNENVMSIFHEE